MPNSRLQPPHQVEDLGLHRHVERGRRLVRDQQLRVRAPAPSRSSPAAACRPRTGAGSRRRAAPGRGIPTRPSSSIARARGLAPRRRLVGADHLGDLPADPVVAGAGSRAGPGRSSRCRAPRTARSSSPSWRAGRGPRTGPAGDAAPRVQARGSSAPRRSCPSRTRRRCRASALVHAERARRGPPGPCRPRCRERDREVTDLEQPRRLRRARGPHRAHGGGRLQPIADGAPCHFFSQTLVGSQLRV